MIEAVVEPRSVAPSASSAWASEAPTLPDSPSPALIDVGAVVRGSGPAVRLRWSTTSGTGERLAWDRYLFWRRGLLCRLTLGGPTGGAGFDPADRVSWSFSWRS